MTRTRIRMHGPLPHPTSSQVQRIHFDYKCCEVGFIYFGHVSKAGTMNGWLQASLAQLKIVSLDMNIISVRCFQQKIRNANNDLTGRSLPPLIKVNVPSRHNSSSHFLLVEVKHNGTGHLDDIIRASARPSSACS